MRSDDEDGDSNRAIPNTKDETSKCAKLCGGIVTPRWRRSNATGGNAIWQGLRRDATTPRSACSGADVNRAEHEVPMAAEFNPRRLRLRNNEEAPECKESKAGITDPMWKGPLIGGVDPKFEGSKVSSTGPVQATPDARDEGPDQVEHRGARSSPGCKGSGTNMGNLRHDKLLGGNESPNMLESKAMSCKPGQAILNKRATGPRWPDLWDGMMNSGYKRSGVNSTGLKCEGDRKDKVRPQCAWSDAGVAKLGLVEDRKGGGALECTCSNAVGKASKCAKLWVNTIGPECVRFGTIGNRSRCGELCNDREVSGPTESKAGGVNAGHVMLKTAEDELEQPRLCDNEESPEWTRSRTENGSPKRAILEIEKLVSSLAELRTERATPKCKESSASRDSIMWQKLRNGITASGATKSSGGTVSSQ